jgi:hypothetical protein
LLANFFASFFAYFLASFFKGFVLSPPVTVTSTPTSLFLSFYAKPDFPALNDHPGLSL